MFQPRKELKRLSKRQLDKLIIRQKTNSLGWALSGTEAPLSFLAGTLGFLFDF
jgi:hypothetical protein